MSRSRTDTPVDKMMSSGGAQNQRPASAPGEDAPSADSADRNEVNISQLLLSNSSDLFLCSLDHCFFPSWVSLNLKVYIKKKTFLIHHS